MKALRLIVICHLSISTGFANSHAALESVKENASKPAHGLSRASDRTRTDHPWTVKHRTTESTVKPWLMVSELKFSQGKRVIKYQPSEPPYGMSNVVELREGSFTYFISSWTHGARTLLIRIFSPETHQAKFICPDEQTLESFISFSPRLEARLNEGRLEVKIMDSEGNFRWQVCEIKAPKN
jgi:hypothetical protein